MSQMKLGAGWINPKINPQPLARFQLLFCQLARNDVGNGSGEEFVGIHGGTITQGKYAIVASMGEQLPPQHQNEVTRFPLGSVEIRFGQTAEELKADFVQWLSQAAPQVKKDTLASRSSAPVQ